ncbi:MAG TPA: hypothetical protein VD862_01135 [Candidatus Paceibacterota bacterium]|nr:hypothetical protein [Candidatus Paceibacterota bacterium]
MKDMKTALTDAGIGKDDEPANTPRFRKAPRLEMTAEERQAAIAAQAVELESRKGYEDFIFPEMEEAVGILMDFGKNATDEKIRATVIKADAYIKGETQNADEPAYRAIARAAWGLALVRYYNRKYAKSLTLDGAKDLVNKQLTGTLLIADPNGKYKFFRQSYVLPERLAELPIANRAVRELERLIANAARNDRRAEREVYEKAVAELNASGSGITLQELVSGGVGTCKASVAPRRTERGRQKGGTLFWNGDGQVVWLTRVFGGVTGFVERNELLSLSVPLDVITAEVFSLNLKNHKMKLQAKQLWQLLQRSLETAAKDAARGAKAGTPAEPADDAKELTDEAINDAVAQSNEAEDADEDATDTTEDLSHVSYTEGKGDEPSPLECGDCDFVGKNPRSLATHRRVHGE